MAANVPRKPVVDPAVLAALDEACAVARAVPVEAPKLSLAEITRQRDADRLARIVSAMEEHLNYETFNGKAPHRPRIARAAGAQVAICYVEVTPSDFCVERAWSDARGKRFLKEVAAFAGGGHACLKEAVSATIHIVPERVRRDDLSDAMVDTFAKTFCALVAALNPVVLVAMGKAQAHLARFVGAGWLAKTHVGEMAYILQAPPLFYAFEEVERPGDEVGVDVELTKDAEDNLDRRAAQDMRRRFNAVRARFRAQAVPAECNPERPSVCSPERLALWDSHVREMAVGNGIVPVVMNSRLKFLLGQLAILVPERSASVNAASSATFFDGESHVARVAAHRLQQSGAKPVVLPAKTAPALTNNAAAEEGARVIVGPTAATLIIPRKLAPDEDVTGPVAAVATKRRPTGITAKKLTAAAKKSKSLDGWAVVKPAVVSVPAVDDGSDTRTNPSESDD